MTLGTETTRASETADSPTVRGRLSRITTLGSCVVTPGERAFRAVAGVLVGVMALSFLPNLWCAIPAGLCSTFLLVGAVTGWCPTDPLPARLARSTATAAETSPNDFGYPELPDARGPRS